MPGMMDTILNLGLTDARRRGPRRRHRQHASPTTPTAASSTCSATWSWASTTTTSRKPSRRSRPSTTPSSTPTSPRRASSNCARRTRRLQASTSAKDFPRTPSSSSSWPSRPSSRAGTASAPSPTAASRASGLNGTAVNVQAMVFGNMGDDSGTGVAFTRNPPRARTSSTASSSSTPRAKTSSPASARPCRQRDAQVEQEGLHQLLKIKHKLEKHYKDMQDIEFTIERGKLYMLQTRTGKRTGAPPSASPCDMVKEKLIDEKTAILRIPAAPHAAPAPQLRPEGREEGRRSDRGASPPPRRRRRQAAFTAEDAVKRAQAGREGHPRPQGNQPRGRRGHARRGGILTSTGGMTSHAAVVARGWGKCCVVGAGELDRRQEGHVTVGKHLRATTSSLDGTTGEVYEGADPDRRAQALRRLRQVMKWADKYRTLGVRTNADTPADASAPATSAPKASACAAPSTCSSRATASRPCAR
jgi:pyruvate,orthophosphate dikinase